MTSYSTSICSGKYEVAQLSDWDKKCTEPCVKTVPILHPTEWTVSTSNWCYKVTLYKTCNTFSTNKHCAVTVHVMNTHEGTEGIVLGINLKQWVVSQLPRKEKKPPLPTEQEVWWTSKPVRALAGSKKSLVPPRLSNLCLHAIQGCW